MHRLTPSLLSHRFLRLTHLGRLSGGRHQSMVEVIGAGPASEEIIVIAGRGRSTDWYRDVQIHPPIEIALDHRRFRPTHRILSGEEAVTVLADYERAHRWFAPARRLMLSEVVGWRYDGTAGARHHLAREFPFVAFRPRAQKPTLHDVDHLDDLDEDQATDETTPFRLDGSADAIDLSTDHAAAQREELVAWVEHAHKTSGRTTMPTRETARADSAPPSPAINDGALPRQGTGGAWSPRQDAGKQPP